MNGWTALGWIGNTAFFSRFLIQWIASERAQRSVVPEVFWWVSLGASACMSTYAAHGGDGVLLAGYVVTGSIYARNVWLRRRSGAGRVGASMALVLGIACIALLVVAASVRADPVPLPMLVVGIVGQSVFSSRFVVQWWLAERRGELGLTAAFWWLSLAGNALLFAYAIGTGDPVWIAAFALGPIVQVRNLVLLASRRSPAAVPAAPTPRPPAR